MTEGLQGCLGSGEPCGEGETGKALLVWLSRMKTENGMISLSKYSECGVSVD